MKFKHKYDGSPLTYLLFFISLSLLFSCKSVPSSSNNLDNQAQFSNKDLNWSDSLDSTLIATYTTSQIPGFSIAVMKEEEVIYDKSLGYANLDSKEKFSTHTVQNIASVSKTIIGVALMKAVELGYLKLDDDINKHLPFKVTNPNFPNQAIKVNHLANHTSSILDTENYARSYFFYDADKLKADDLVGEYKEMFSVAKTNQLIDESEFLENYLSPTGKWFDQKVFNNKTPGSQFEYSNVAATLAAYIIEQASGMTYEAFTKKYIFDPLQMTETGWEKTDLPNSTFASRYFSKSKKVPDYYLITKADGGLLTNTHDYSKFFIEMIKGFNGNGQLLSKSSYEMLFSKQVKVGEKRSMGTFWILNNNKPGFMHDGSDPGVMTLVAYDGEKGVGKVFFCNLDATEENIEAIISIWQAVGGHNWKQ